MTMMSVSGQCPACANRTLFLTEPAGVVACRFEGCADPALLADFLEQVHQPDQHYTVFTDTDWYTEHTIRCRLEGLGNCLIHRALVAMPSPPVEPGRYAVTMVSGELFFDEVAPEPAPVDDTDPGAGGEVAPDEVP